MNLTTYTLEGEARDKLYVDLKDVKSAFPHWGKGTRGLQALVALHGLKTSISGRSMNGVIAPTSTQSKKYGSVYATLTEVESTFVKYAPPIIRDKDLVFFKNDDVEYTVTMRGERTQNGIYFDANELATLFQKAALPRTIKYGSGAFKDGVHYAQFMIKSSREDENAG